MSEGTFRPDLLEGGISGHAAWASGEEAHRTDGPRADARSDEDRSIAWWAHVEPLVQEANEKAEQIRRVVADAQGLVAAALDPVNEALADMNRLMTGLAESLRPPAGRPNVPDVPAGAPRPFGSPDGGVASTASPVATADLPVGSQGHEGVWSEPTTHAVTWPSKDARGHVSVTRLVGPQGHQMDGGRTTATDDDDAALVSTAARLRRAVTDIDWSDLPSASNG
jgi:hypothetical protein